MSVTGSTLYSIMQGGTVVIGNPILGSQIPNRNYTLTDSSTMSAEQLVLCTLMLHHITQIGEEYLNEYVQFYRDDSRISPEMIDFYCNMRVLDSSGVRDSIMKCFIENFVDNDNCLALPQDLEEVIECQIQAYDQYRQEIHNQHALDFSSEALYIDDTFY